MNDNQTTSRTMIAVETLLRQPLDPEYAGDGSSVLLSFGRRLDRETLLEMSQGVKETSIDLVHFEFDSDGAHEGPVNVVVIAERDGLLFWWTDCQLWAPLGDGPLLVMPRGINVCFGYDGKALVSRPARPTKAVEAGIARAARRVRNAARKVTERQLETFIVSNGMPMAA